MNDDSDLSYKRKNNDVISNKSNTHQNSNKQNIELVGRNKEIVKDRLLDFINNSNNQICICKDSKSSFFLDIDKSIFQACKSFHESGGIIRYITEINQDNVYQCNEINQFCHLKHLDNINGNLAINDKDEYITSSIAQDKDYYIIYSNSREIRDKQQQVFEIYWNKAIDGSKKIKQLKEQIEAKGENQNWDKNRQRQQDKTILTQISSNSIDKTTKENLNQLIKNSKWIGICCNLEWISRIQQEVYDNIMDMIDTFADRNNNGNGNKKELLDTNPHLNNNNSNDIFKDDNSRKKNKDINRGNNSEGDHDNKYYDVLNNIQINKIQWLSPITTENRGLVKKYLGKGIEFRNIENIPINFIVSDIHCIFAIENFDVEREGFQVFFSDDEIYVKHFNELFKKLWKIGQNAVDRIKQNEELDQKVKKYYEKIQQAEEKEGPKNNNININKTATNDITYNQSKQQRKSNSIENPEKEITEIIYNSEEFAKRMLEMTKKTRHDIMFVLASSNAFNQSLDFGAFDIFNRLVKEKSTNIRILLSTPLSPESEVVLDTKEKEKEDKEVEKIKNYVQNAMPDVKFELVDKKNYYKEAEGMSILVIDHAEVLCWEVNKDAIDVSRESTRLAIYSNSRPLVLSYNSIFESLWNSTQLYNDLKEANKKILKSERLQKEFIDITAHELRTPIQSIIGYSEMGIEMGIEMTDQKKVTKTTSPSSSPSQQDKLFETINKNANRIHRLLEDFLNVTRIENNLLTLHMENTSIYTLVKDVVNEFNEVSYIKSREASKTKIKINFVEPNFDHDPIVNIDKTKIYQVISNLLNNALKFSPSNKAIVVTLEIGQESEFPVDNITTLSSTPSTATATATATISGTSSNITTNNKSKSNDKNLYDNKEVGIKSKLLQNSNNTYDRNKTYNNFTKKKKDCDNKNKGQR